MASATQWSPIAAVFGPARGSAAFSTTPCPTPTEERESRLDSLPNAALREESSRLESASSTASARTERSRSVDSAVTLVEDAPSTPHKKTDSLLPPLGSLDDVPKIDGSSEGIILLQVADKSNSKSREWRWAMTDRELYHRLQNVSAYPSAVAIARRRVFKETANLLANDDALSQDPLHIFSLSKRFDPQAFRDFLKRQHDATTAKYTQYSERRTQAIRQARQAGMRHSESRRAGMEMFSGGREAAKRWLRRSSVVKYVDGAWLQHLLRVTTGLSESLDGGVSSICASSERTEWLREQRRAARASWQVMTEELGDGDLSRSHVAIYENLMDALAAEDGEPHPPKGEDREFIRWSGAGGREGEAAFGQVPDEKSGAHSSGNARCWRSGVSQLALSISPNEYLPESIGWNSSYEGLPYHLLVSSRELQEHDIDAYYFWLHVSIDNAATGHSAMARECVVNFIEAAERTHGHAFADEMWARVKLGFALADFIPTTPTSAAKAEDVDYDDTPAELTYTLVTREDTGGLAPGLDEDACALDQARQEMAHILESKATIAHGLHGGVHAKIAGEPLSYWLDPEHARERSPLLLDALANNPAWITRGDPKSSRFVQEFEWGGKMFGAMTAREVNVLKRWVSLLKMDEPAGSALESTSKPHLPQDEDVERLDRQIIDQWLLAQKASSDAKEDQSKTPPAGFATAENLRSFALPAALQGSKSPVTSWPDFTKRASLPLLSALVERPDAIRPRPHDLTNLILTLSDNAQPIAIDTAKPSWTHLPAAALEAKYPLPTVTSSEEVRSLIPTLSIATALIEHCISLSPGRLASPLGMAAVKILRILHGFTEESEPDEQQARGGDGSETGCMGTDDSLSDDAKSWWELVERAWNHLERRESGEEQAMLLSSFNQRPVEQVALMSLSLLLSQHFWSSASVLLGMMLAVLSVARRDPVFKTLATGSSDEEAADLHRRLSAAVAWLARAIEIGVEAEQVGCLPRGVELINPQSTWTAEVSQGWALAVCGMKQALARV